MILILTSVMAVTIAQQDTATNFILWEDGSEHSDSYYSDGLRVLQITHDGVVVAATLERRRWKAFEDSWQIHVQVWNGTNARLDVNPATIRLVDREKLEYVEWQPADWILDEYGDVETAGRMGFADIFSQGLTSSILGTAPRDLTSELTARAMQAQAVGAGVSGGALRRNTVFPDGSVAGTVWYKHDGEELSVQVPVFDRVFEFPFVWQN